MRISEVNSKLDARCVIAIAGRSGAINLLSRIDEKVPGYIYTNDGNLYLQLFFAKTAKTSSALSSILSRSDVASKGSYNIISEKVKEPDIVKSVSKLISSTSIAMNDTYVYHGELYLDFRFHSSSISTVNDMLVDFMQATEGFRLVRLAGSRTLKERIDDIKSVSEISIIRYFLPIEILDDFGNYMKTEHPDAVVELEGRSYSSGGVKMLLYTNKKVTYKGVETISEKDNIYQYNATEGDIIEGRNSGIENKIPRIALYITLNNDRLFFTSFVPSAVSMEYVSVLLSSKIGKNNLTPVLDYYAEVDEEIWKWL